MTSVITYLLVQLVMALKKTQRSLKAWGKQKWRTKSGKPSTQGPKATGERYLPSAAIKALSPSEYAATTAKSAKQLEKENKWLNSPKRLQKKRRDLESSRDVMEKLKYASSSS